MALYTLPLVVSEIFSTAPEVAQIRMDQVTYSCEQFNAHTSETFIAPVQLPFFRIPVHPGTLGSLSFDYWMLESRPLIIIIISVMWDYLDRHS